MTEFEPGELFVYTRDGGCDHMELGQVKRKAGDDAYFCWYSRGDTASRTPVANMRKLANAGWSHIERDPWYELASSEVSCPVCGLVMDISDAGALDECPRCFGTGW